MRLDTVLLGHGIKMLISTMQMSKQRDCWRGLMPGVFGFSSLCVSSAFPAKNWFLSRCRYFHGTHVSAPFLVLILFISQGVRWSWPQGLLGPSFFMICHCTGLWGSSHLCGSSSVSPASRHGIHHAEVLCDWTLCFLVLLSLFTQHEVARSFTQDGHEAEIN